MRALLLELFGGALFGATMATLLLAVILHSTQPARMIAPSQNDYGGYRAACGELPPLQGDDC